jgi:hypothetical protein
MRNNEKNQRSCGVSVVLSVNTVTTVIAQTSNVQRHKLDVHVHVR